MTDTELFGFACSGGNRRSIDFLTALGRMDIDAGLISACRAKNCEIARLMIDRGANNLDEALLIATEQGDVPTAQLLLERGATNIDRALIASICRDSPCLAVLCSRSSYYSIIRASTTAIFGGNIGSVARAASYAFGGKN